MIVAQECLLLSIDSTFKNGKVRLTNGLTQYEGRVEIYWNSEWKLICNNDWDNLDALVVCRQLGYLPTSMQIHGIHNKLLLYCTHTT